MSDEVQNDAETSETTEVVETAAPALEAGSTENLFSGAPTESAAAAEPVFEPVLRGKLDKFGVAMGTGRRKTSVARVRVKPGTGLFSINGRTLEDFCCVEKHREIVMAPLMGRESTKEKNWMDGRPVRILSYKVPSKVVFRTELPKSLIGKVLRRKLSMEETGAVA